MNPAGEPLGFDYHRGCSAGLGKNPSILGIAGHQGTHFSRSFKVPTLQSLQQSYWNWYLERAVLCCHIRIFFFISVLIFGCTGSSLLHGLFPSCIAQASHYSDFSCCGAGALRCKSFSSCSSQALEHRSAWA